VLDDHPLGDAALVAAPAEQGAFEVVVVNSTALVSGGAGVGDGLNAVEQVRADYRS
jgi:hypothetical protein